MGIDMKLLSCGFCRFAVCADLEAAFAQFKNDALSAGIPLRGKLDDVSSDRFDLSSDLSRFLERNFLIGFDLREVIALDDELHSLKYRPGAKRNDYQG